MATTTRKRVVKNKTAPTAAKRRRKAPAVRRTKKSAGNFANFFVPFFFILCILFCLGFLSFMGYRTVTASEFFDVKKIDVRGLSRASKSDVEAIVASQTEKSGAWNADLNIIKEKVEKLAFVKSAAVSRVLPDGVRVNLIERVPKAIVRINGGDFWADDEGTVLAPVGKNEERLPFVMRGWDEMKTDEANKDNQARVRVYQKMLEEWRSFDLANRVQSVDLSDVKNPQVIAVSDGIAKKVFLPKDNFGKKLQLALEHLAGREKDFAGVDVSETSPRLIPN
ncbi:MAG: FtsQ-type POTRA domain-containing protein [Pyrinomonadaceae bacterium]|nr:FtsQ-type POTRA domain-containing protein [Pyrinomonadaceae bacterium]